MAEEILKNFFFIERGYLNGNHFLLRGEQPVLVDTGYIGDFARTQALLEGLGVEVELAMFGMGRRAQSGRDLLNLLYRKPFVTAGEIATGLSTSVPTANALIRDFVELGILKQVSGIQRNRVFAFERYFSLFLS